MRVAWLTNDLPPRAGGIERFIGELVRRSWPEDTVVIGPRGDAEAARHDAEQAYRTVRAPGAVLPTRTIHRLAVTTVGRHRADVLVLGASWPLGTLAPRLRRELGIPVVALSHGLEAGLARAGGGLLVHRATRGLDALTTISDWTERQLGPHARATRCVRIPPGVDVERFRPGLDGGALRRAWGVPDDALVVGCVSRLVARKGQDRLISTWPQVLRAHPDAWLVLVGEGPSARGLAARRDRLGAAGRRIVLAGRSAWDALPATYAAFDVFAMPCRTRLGGLDVEGLGIVYLEAQACGVPAIAGRSGGAPEAVRDAVTGSVVDGRDGREVLAAIDRWLGDPAARRRAGEHARAWTEERWSWAAIAARFRSLLEETAARGG